MFTEHLLKPSLCSEQHPRDGPRFAQLTILDSEVQRSFGSDHCSQPNYDQKRNTSSDGGELEIAGEGTVARQGLSEQRSGIETKSHLPRDRREPGLAARVPAGSDRLAQ